VLTCGLHAGEKPSIGSGAGSAGASVRSSQQGAGTVPREKTGGLRYHGGITTGSEPTPKRVLVYDKRGAIDGGFALVPSFFAGRHLSFCVLFCLYCLFVRNWTYLHMFIFLSFLANLWVCKM